MICVRKLSCLALLLSLSACASEPIRPPGVPRDVPQPSRVQLIKTEGFKVWIDRACLHRSEQTILLRELRYAKKRLLEYLGTARAPGDFRPRNEPRPACPSPVALPVPDPIEVVVLRGGHERCHADSDGITVLKAHLERRDTTHELTHFLAGSSWRPLDEGLAVYLTERLWGADNAYPIKTRARVFSDLGLAEDLDPALLEEDGMSRRDYDLAGAFVGWLIESYGKERFWKLYHGPTRNYHPTYDMSEAELWERFWLYVRNLDVRHDGPYHAFKAKLTQRE